ncbi:MAG TPA: hypothetical protein VND45_14150 [Thermoanaerobaculia bacterium]|jgi:hypothetical protein|nr:hypothetical protein [Thermoanaerobaculia bacterium]
MTRKLIAFTFLVVAGLARAQDHMAVVRSTYGADPNKFPLNPQWKCQRDGNCPGNTPQLPNADALCDKLPVPPACATQFDLDQPTNAFKRVICSLEPSSKVHGHVNFTPATFYGRLEWEERSADADFNFALTPARGNGTTATATSIHSEFDSRETLRMFRKSFGWWGDLYAAVPDNKKVRRLIDSTAANAVITGLFGLDCEHHCKPELHPVYLMGVRAPGVTNRPERWAVFARTSGNEGYCASKRHSLAGEELHLLLPNRLATVVAGTPRFYGTRSGMKQPVITPVTNVGVLITFRVRGEDVIVGELELERSPSGGIASFSLPRATQKQLRMEEAADKEDERESAEGMIERLLEGRTAVEQENFESFTLRSLGSDDQADAQSELQVEIRPAISEAEYRARLEGLAVSDLSQADDAQQAQNDERIRRALCAAYNDRLPDPRLKDACKP